MPRLKSNHVDDPVTVGLRLKDARERAGISQRQLAFRGCTSAYISRIESGDRIPSLQILRELGSRLGVSADYLATGSDYEEAPASEQLVEAEVALRLDDTDLAQRLYREGLKEATTAADQARALGGLGQLAFRQGDPHAAIAQLEHALELFGEEAETRSSAADTLGRAYAMVGELESAIALFERYLQAAERRGDLVERLRFAVLLANALIDSGNFGGAGELLGRTLVLADDWCDPILRARLYWSQSRLHLEQYDAPTAARYARRALDILELTEHTLYTGRAHQLLAQVELARDRPEDALSLLEHAWPLLVQSGSKLEQAQFRLEEARALSALGRREEAAPLAMSISGMLSEASPEDAGRSYAVLAQIFDEMGDRPKARELYELAAEILERNPNRYLVDVYSRLAELLEAEGRQLEALDVLKKAVGIQVEVGAGPSWSSTVG